MKRAGSHADPVCKHKTPVRGNYTCSSKPCHFANGLRLVSDLQGVKWKDDTNFSHTSRSGGSWRLINHFAFKKGLNHICTLLSTDTATYSTQVNNIEAKNGNGGALENNIICSIVSGIKQEHTSHQNKVIKVCYAINHSSESMYPCCPVSSQLTQMFCTACVLRSLPYS